MNIHALSALSVALFCYSAVLPAREAMAPHPIPSAGQPKNPSDLKEPSRKEEDESILELPDQEVIDRPPAFPEVEFHSTEELSSGLPADSADALRSIPGISIRRMGGHGLEPIIRGQSQNRVNILMDGAYIFGACPNRMDPPTSYVPLESFDQIEVIKGVHSVQYGSGGSGGTVIFKRKRPDVSANDPATGRVSVGYRDNSETGNVSFDLAAGNVANYIRTFGSWTDADNYEDGDGNSTRSAFIARNAGFIAGISPTPGTWIEWSGDFARDKDNYYAGAGMDGVYNNSDTFRISVETKPSWAWSDQLKFEWYQANVDHLMDNYSLRPVGKMQMRAPSTSDTTGGRLTMKWLPAPGWNGLLGMDVVRNKRDAERLHHTENSDMLQSVLWPKATLEQLGWFTEMSRENTWGGTIKGGVRYDRVESEAEKASVEPSMGLSPQELYRKYYDTQATDIDEDNVGAFLRYEHAFASDRGSYFAVVSRSVRTADATERYLASNGMSGMPGWVGNPDLDPEIHRQVETGLRWQEQRFDSGISIYYNDVDDYILRDRAQLQAGIASNDGSSIYRNVSAEFYGTELETSVELGAGFQVSGSLAYTHANNTDDDRALPQIPPLEGTLELRFKKPKYELGTRLRLADNQDRIDLISGQDPRETPGFAALDMRGAIDLPAGVRLDIGMDNVFDKTYAYHVNRANVDPFNPDPIQVNEPGRFAWMRISYNF